MCSSVKLLSCPAPGSLFSSWSPSCSVRLSFVLFALPLMKLIACAGFQKISPAYYSVIKRFFELPQCVGMLGGRPKHAIYFIGYQGAYTADACMHCCQWCQVTI